jgi:hypothetical protein
MADWDQEPFRQPGAMMVYSAIMSDYFAKNTFTTDDNSCRNEGCTERALRISLFCRDHHIESLQSSGSLPKKPMGRMFPPYSTASGKP